MSVLELYVWFCLAYFSPPKTLFLKHLHQYFFPQYFPKSHTSVLGVYWIYIVRIGRLRIASKRALYLADLYWILIPLISDKCSEVLHDRINALLNSDELNLKSQDSNDHNILPLCIRYNVLKSKFYPISRIGVEKWSYIEIKKS